MKKREKLLANLVELAKLQKNKGKMFSRAKIVISEMTGEILDNYSKWLKVDKLDDDKILLTMFGNSILIKAEIILSRPMSGHISFSIINLDAHDDKDRWEKLDIGYSFDELGNIDQKHDGHKITNLLIKSLLDILSKKNGTVRPVEVGSIIYLIIDPSRTAQI
jgi:hypothetical protein